MTRSLLTAALTLLLAATASAQQAVQVTAGTLNVRSGPGTSYAIVGQAHAGEVYAQVATSGSWRKI